MPSDVTVTIRAVDAASKTISGVATQLAGLAKAKAAFDKDAAKAAAETQKLETLRSKTLTENERRLTMFNQSQARVATENQRRLTEEQRTLTANNKMQLDAYNNIIKTVGNAAKIDAQVAKTQAQTAGQNIKNTQAQQGALIRLQKEHEQTGKSAQDAQKKTRQEIETTNTKIKSQADNLKALAIKFAAIAAAIIVVQRAISKAFEFAQEGAQLERLQVTGEKLAQSFGVNMTDAVEKINAASLDTITTQQAILEINRSLLLGIASDADTMASLMEIAALRGRAFGLDTTEAFDRITLGIGRLSTRILDDIGIVIDGETAYANYGKSIGKAADELTEAEKRIALTNAIIEDGNRLLEQTGGLVDDAASAYARLETNIQDTENSIKQFTGGALLPLVEAINLLVFDSNAWSNSLLANADEIAKTSKTHDEYLKRLLDSGETITYLIARTKSFNEALSEQHPIISQLVAQWVLFEMGLLSTAPFITNIILSLNLWGDVMENQRRIISERIHGEGEFGQRLEENALKIEQYTAALEGLSQIKGISADLGFESAAQAVINYNEAIGASPRFLQQLEFALGLVDAAIIKFRAALKAATEITSEGGRNITADEFLRAFLPIGTAQYNARIRELTDQLKEDLAEVQRRAAEQIADVQRDFGQRQLDDQIDLERDLADLRDDASDKQEDASKKHKRKMEDIEEDYQRQVSKIMRKFELSRIKALIDLDARALFEAEQQRDDDLKDAAEARDDKKKDEEEDYKDRIDELKEFEEDRRAEILRAYERRRQDALRDLARRIADIKADEAQRKAMLEADFASQVRKTKEELDKIIKRFQTHYNERAKDMLNFFQTNQNILDALKRGALDPTDILNQFNQVGGIPFGGLPFTPVEPNQPPPPGTHDCPPGKIWDPDAGHCVWEDEFGLTGGGGNTLTGDRKVRGTLTLNVAGEGMFAQMLRSSIASQFIEIISD